MKIVSQLDSMGYFVAPVAADPSPRERGVFLLPGGAINVTPPTVPEGQRARWTGEWVYEPVPMPNPEPEPETPSEPTPLQQIEALEREHMAPRWQREFTIGAMEREAIEMGAAQSLTSEQSVAILRSKNSGYRKIKELDEQIELLRAQL